MNDPNVAFDLTHVDLSLALQVAYYQPSGYDRSPLLAAAWAVQEPNPLHSKDPHRAPERFLLLTQAADGTHLLPGRMDAEQVEPLIRSWLAEAKYGRRYDTDGDCKRGGIRVYNVPYFASFGSPLYSAFVAVEPAWLVYGK